MRKQSAVHRYNWRRDMPDQRDRPYHLSNRIGPAMELPSLVDLRSKCSPIMDQGPEGSCTAHALAGLFEFLEIRQIADKIPGSETFDSLSHFHKVSRNFIYWNERVMEGNPYQDAGAEIRDGIKSLAQIGVCRESLWPYGKEHLFQKPTDVAFAEAAHHKIGGYVRLSNLIDMKDCLAGGNPFAFGFTVYQSFESQAVAQSGIANLPWTSEKPVGGHAVLAVGYDDSKQRFIVRNSWGVGWGLQGYFSLPYAYLTNPHLAADFWTFTH